MEEVKIDVFEALKKKDQTPLEAISGTEPFSKSEIIKLRKLINEMDEINGHL